MDIKPLKYYIGFMLVILFYFGYATWNGITFWADKAEKNTEYTNTSRGHFGSGARFYHK
ncbi:hypothetical protein [Desertivirga brevis]|uniref:hypothetical protein n=1 Tax=Desertivirga brevis TaxID=2810310 RepID=UPI001A973BD6|nr:hypothetical protein [Pedobacter sp. SYSU D00873]